MSASDPAALARYREVLSLWNVTRYIQWKRVPLDWLNRELPGYTARAIAELMWLHVEAGAKVDQVVEKRPEYVSYRFHYDVRLPISGRRIYIETVLLEDDEPDATILVVSIHDA